MRILVYRGIKYLVLILWSAFVAGPFLWALSTSFKNDAAVVSGATYIPFVDFEPSLEGWEVLFKATEGVNIFGPYVSSLVVTLVSSLVSLALGTFAAYGLSRFTFRAGPLGNTDITFFFISQRIITPVVLAIPYFLLLKMFRLLDTHVGLIIIYIAMLMPIVVWIMVDFFNNISTELDEAALIDGCTPVEAFYKIILPECVPGLVVTGLLCFIFAWNDFFFAFTLTFADTQLLPVSIVALNSSKVPWWSLSSSSLIAILPLVFLAIWLERYLTRGALLGALK
ncbi:MAG: carbohydrate ABC transporter permease [Deltaproteobacteria bacterium]|nr:carbohydrate ABC transporter permease [Deltaproteobacteria bacterium]MBW2050323.1 carbohydrate ABC transporter permease [Deltaproteobacteria bacterium]MBW2112848.1 carbohydrate ABC transporter permease [Deltaproteobacteria bacterium]MBW2353612.1 carbohydrate ABC transporter permease [Deltaproteobacteria bacterium]HDZ89313.1 carbohydrate ABC transporter permease [Deltaproteobacteria bacterium]